MWSVFVCAGSASVHVMCLCICMQVSVCKCLWETWEWGYMSVSAPLTSVVRVSKLAYSMWNYYTETESNYTDCGQLFTWLLIFTAAVYNGNPSSQGPLFSTDQSESRLIPLSPKKDFVIFHLRLTKYTYQLHISSLSGNRKFSSLACSVTQ